MLLFVFKANTATEEKCAVCGFRSVNWLMYRKGKMPVIWRWDVEGVPQKYFEGFNGVDCGVEYKSYARGLSSFSLSSSCVRDPKETRERIDVSLLAS
jgi:hypothetical protein